MEVGVEGESITQIRLLPPKSMLSLAVNHWHLAHHVQCLIMLLLLSSLTRYV